MNSQILRYISLFTYFFCAASHQCNKHNLLDHGTRRDDVTTRRECGSRSRLSTERERVELSIESANSQRIHINEYSTTAEMTDSVVLAAVARRRLPLFKYLLAVNRERCS